MLTSHKVILWAALAAACLAGAGRAASCSWDTVPDNGVVDDGSGTWAANAATWTTNGGISNIPWPGTTNDIALFSGTQGGDVTVSGSFAAGGIVFGGTGANAYRISGDGAPCLTLAGRGIAVSNAAGPQFLDSSLTLSLTVSQAWTNESAGLLTIGSALSVTSAVTLTLGGSGNTLFDGSLAEGPGVLSVAKTGSGALTLAGAPGCSGTTAVSAGTLTVSNCTVTALNVSGGTANVIRASGALAANVGGGTLYLDGNVTNSLRVSGGSVVIGEGVTVGTADFRQGSGAVDATRPLTVTNQAIFDINVRVVQADGGPFTLCGADVIHPAATNRRTIAIQGGTLKIGDASYPTAGLVGRWTFDDGTARDSSGNGYDGVAVNGPSYDTNDVGVAGGKALVQSGSSYVKVDTGGMQTVFDGGTSMTISVWIKGWPGREVSFVSKYGDGAQGWRIGRHLNNGWMWWMTRGTTNEEMHQNLGSIDGVNWCMFTMTYDGATKRIYYKGVLDGEMPAGGTITPTTAWLIFGGRSDANHAIGGGNWGLYSGKLDDIHFYNRAISAEEVTQLFSYVNNLEWRATDLAVRGTNQVCLPAGVTSLGKLALSGANTRLSFATNGAVRASLEQISAGGDASIEPGLPISLRTGNVTVAGGGTLTIGANIVDDVATNGLNKLGGGALVLAGANAYSGDTRIREGSLSLAAPCLPDRGDVYVYAGTTLALDFKGTDVIRSLYLGGFLQEGGVWAAVGSSAPHNHESALLTGSGTLMVTAGPGMILYLR